MRPLGASLAAAALVLLVILCPVPVAAAPRLLGLIDLPPIGVADSYGTPAKTTLVVAAPGVLANDTDLDSTQLTALLVSKTSHGNVTLGAAGGFSYQPDGGFSGVDTFTYRPFDGTLQALLPVTVSITVAPRLSSPSPTPRATPTPTPTSTPTPTPSPTPTPTPTPFLPIPTLTLPPLPIPTPTLPPLLPPTPTPPVALPGVTSPPLTPTVTPTPSPSSVPTATRPPVTGPGGVAVGTTGGGGSARGGPLLPPTILIPAAGTNQVSFGSFGGVGIGIEWVVPSVLVTVPGFLLIVIGLTQFFGGFVWLPVARRWLRGDGRRSAARTSRFGS